MKKYIVLSGIIGLLISSSAFSQIRPTISQIKSIPLPQVVGYRLIPQAQTAVGYGLTPSQARINSGYYGQTSYDIVRPIQIENTTIWVAKKTYTAPAYTPVYSRSSVNAYLKATDPSRYYSSQFKNRLLNQNNYNNIRNRNSNFKCNNYFNR